MMADLKRSLERESDRYELAPGALGRMLDRRQRRHRTRRVTAVVVSLAIILSLGAVISSLSGLGPQTTPGSVPSPTSLDGTWRSAPLNEDQIAAAFTAAGGTETEGRAFFSRLGQGADRYVEITLRFEGGSFVEFESADGGPSVVGYEANADVRPDGRLVRVGSQRFRIPAGSMAIVL